MGVENIFPSLKIPTLARRKPISLEGSFHHAYKIFDALPTTCLHIGDRDFSCGRAKLVLPESVSGLFGINGNGPAEREVFLAAHQSNDKFKRRALMLVEVEGGSVVFRVEGISIEEIIEDETGEETNGKIVTNFRDVFLDREGVQSRRVEPGSVEYIAFKQLLPLAKAIRERPDGLLCLGCTAKKVRSLYIPNESAIKSQSLESDSPR